MEREIPERNNRQREPARRRDDFCGDGDSNAQRWGELAPVKLGRGNNSAYCGQDVPAIDVNLLIDIDPEVKPESVGAQAAVPWLQSENVNVSVPQFSMATSPEWYPGGKFAPCE